MTTNCKTTKNIKALMKTSLVVIPLSLLSVSAFAMDRYQISVARMFDRTTADLSHNFFITGVKDRDEFGRGRTFAIVFSAGIGAVRWDNAHNSEGRLHADASITVISVHFSVGPFITSGAVGPALGIRTALGYKSPRSLFVSGYWEVAAGLPGTERGTRAGVGIQVGIGF